MDEGVLKVADAGESVAAPYDGADDVAVVARPKFSRETSKRQAKVGLRIQEEYKVADVFRGGYAGHPLEALVDGAWVAAGPDVFGMNGLQAALFLWRCDSRPRLIAYVSRLGDYSVIYQVSRDAAGTPLYCTIRSIEDH